MNLKHATAAVLTLALGASVAFADGDAKALDSAIKARKGQMQLYSHNLGVLGAMAKGEVDYDAAAAQAAADNLVLAASLNAGNMWPAGSDNSLGNNRAKPEIWANFPDVAAKAGAMSDAAAAMASAAGTDLASLQAAMGGVGGACSACHKAYRSR